MFTLFNTFAITSSLQMFLRKGKIDCMFGFFEIYPSLESIYQLTIAFRNIYQNKLKQRALEQFNEWKQQVMALKSDEFNTVIHSIEYHLDNILNFFDNRSTNANAESFNSKIKGFRANLRGVTDVKFFLFRLQKLFA